MYEVEIDGKPLYQLPAPGPGGGPSTLAFSLPKAGSTMLDNLLTRLAPAAGLSFVAYTYSFFQAGISEEQIPENASSLFRQHGYCYAGFRMFPTHYDIPILETAPVLFLVRDPRDMLVSHYFSMRHSHNVPGADGQASESFLAYRQQLQTTTADDHALNTADWYLTQFQRYAPILELPLLKVFRYEDIVYRKRQFVSDICEHYGWNVDPVKISVVAAMHDRFPEIEQPKDHVRQAHPGDHVRKLKPQTIAALNGILAGPLEQFGYPRHVPLD